jgi:hypothetical protein
MISKEKEQYKVLFGMFLVVLGLTGWLYLADKQVFRRFIGEVDPLRLRLLFLFFNMRRAIDDRTASYPSRRHYGYKELAPVPWRV